MEEDPDSEEGGMMNSIYKKVPPEQVKDKTIITLGGIYVNDSDLQSMIIKFNKRSDEYRIRIVDYSSLITDGD